MAPDGTTNLAVKDLVNALQFLKQVVPAFGGNPNKITIAGQSSGAHLVRSLLAAPSASSLFRYGIIQSDPMVGPAILVSMSRCTKPFPEFWFLEHFGAAVLAGYVQWIHWLRCH